MNIAVISGSMRPQSQSLKVTNWLADHLRELGINADVLDLDELDLPRYDDSGELSDNVEKLLGVLNECDAAVFVSPEWNGMMSYGLINMQHYLGKQLAHKPVMLAGVSSGRGGHYPLMQMRTMGYKNNQYVISPEALLVQGVNEIMNDHEPEVGSVDESVQARADYALRNLIEYAKALKAVKDSGVVDFDKYKNGV